PVEDFSDLRRAGLCGVLVPPQLGGDGAGFADYTTVAYELARGNGATALVFNMHASVTGAMAAVDSALAGALGMPEEALAARDTVLRGAAEGGWYAVAMSARGVGSLPSRLTPRDEAVAVGHLVQGS